MLDSSFVLVAAAALRDPQSPPDAAAPVRPRSAPLLPRPRACPRAPHRSVCLQILPPRSAQGRARRVGAADVTRARARRHEETSAVTNFGRTPMRTGHHG
ncbi:hypothetical protein GCM10023224_02060 [Streptomonospora halophila]|uniref:Uncharacterized protein n=1 Tax=Streptomonospora halophila TaxID=427369 RepID=A0ABP9G2Z0_9ACTN